MKIQYLPIGAYALAAVVQAQSSPSPICDLPNEADRAAVNAHIDTIYSTCPDGMEDDLCGKSPWLGDIYKTWVNEKQAAPCILVDEVPGLTPGAYDRNLNDDIPFNCANNMCNIAIDLRGIWGYGCWCNFGGKLLNGRGSPVSAHDNACKNMQMCLRCAEMDGLKDDYPCDPRTVSYNSTLGQSGGQNNNINSLNSGCQVLNSNDLCGAHVCTCELQLINDILKLVWEQQIYDIAPRHPSNPFGGDFDSETNCITDPGITEIACCGKYPFRSTYNSLRQSCCLPVEKLYNSFDTMCCADGLRAVGNGAC